METWSLKMETWRLKMEHRRVYRPVVADLKINLKRIWIQIPINIKAGAGSGPAM
jgi:hypothetical protein